MVPAEGYFQTRIPDDTVLRRLTSALLSPDAPATPDAVVHQVVAVVRSVRMGVAVWVECAN